jgi:predicted RNA methylase
MVHVYPLLRRRQLAPSRCGVQRACVCRPDDPRHPVLDVIAIDTRLTLAQVLEENAVKIALPLLLCGVVASPVSYADTETIKLTCDLHVKTQPPYGDSKQSHETAVVEMLLDAATGFKAILIHSVAIPVSVANKKGGGSHVVCR